MNPRTFSTDVLERFIDYLSQNSEVRNQGMEFEAEQVYPTSVKPDRGNYDARMRWKQENKQAKHGRARLNLLLGFLRDLRYIESRTASSHTFYKLPPGAYQFLCERYEIAKSERVTAK
jgi:hypothetical protein